VLDFQELVTKVGKQAGAGRIVIAEGLGDLELKPVSLWTDLEDAVALVSGRVDPHEWS
jgi:hypothetical protein